MWKVGLKESTDCGKSNDMLAESNSGAASTDVIAYVDGSYRADTGEFSYGMVILQDGQEQCFCQKMTDKELATMHNVAGEIKGSEAAMKYAVDHNIPEITIYHDYEGIAKWCTGAWKATKPGTIAYRAFYREAVKKVKVHFVKVKDTPTTNTTIWLTSLQKSSRNPVADPGAFVICAPHIFV